MLDHAERDVAIWELKVVAFRAINDFVLLVFRDANVSRAVNGITHSIRTHHGKFGHLYHMLLFARNGFGGHTELVSFDVLGFTNGDRDHPLVKIATETDWNNFKNAILELP